MLALRTILVVEDSRSVREFIEAAVLRPAGFATLTAEDGKRGLKIAREAQPDLIITDWQMPDLDGLAMIRQLQAERHCPPAILITAEGSTALAAEALQAGVMDYLVKPFEPDQLLAAIERALPKSAAR